MSVSGTVDSSYNDTDNSLPHKFASKTSFLNLNLYILIAIISTCALLVVLLVFLCIRLKRASRKRNKVLANQSSGLIPLVSKEIVEIKALDRKGNDLKEEVKMGNVNLTKEEEIEAVVDLEIGEGKQKQKKSGESDDASCSASSDASSAEAQQNIGWGRWYSLKELEVATRGFVEENVIGEGGYGVVYRGVLEDGSVVAVKNLLNNK